MESNRGGEFVRVALCRLQKVFFILFDENTVNRRTRAREYLPIRMRADSAALVRLPTLGQRVAVHYDVKFRRITVGTSRQGMGVTVGSSIRSSICSFPLLSTSRALDLTLR